MNPAKFISDAFSHTQMKKYLLNSAGWWKVYGKKLPTLQALAMDRTQRYKSSSSSAERNWSIWGIVQSKLRS